MSIIDKTSLVVYNKVELSNKDREVTSTPPEENPLGELKQLLRR